MLKLESVPKAYGAIVTVDDLSLTVGRGELLGLLGPNGAGKSTTVDLSVGLIAPDRGRVSIEGLGTPVMTIAGIGRTEQAAAGVGWALLMPMALLGGAMMPQFVMPSWMRTLGQISPIKWAMLAIEGAVWRGVHLGRDVAALRHLVDIRRGLLRRWSARLKGRLMSRIPQAGFQ